MLNESLHPVSSVFVPLFFVLMGIQVQVGSIARPDMLLFASMLTVCALLGKLACGMGVVTRGVRRLAVGIGMIPRGEVGLIFAGLGTTLSLQGEPVLPPPLFSAVVIMVLVTTLVTPVGLRWAFRGPEQPRQLH